MIALLLDTETTGLLDNKSINRLEKQPHIIEFYSCLADLDTGEVLSEIDELICPPTRELITDEITKITGIRYDMVEGKRTFKEVSGTIFAALEAAPAVCAHNLSFDMGMIDVEARRLGKTVAWPKRKICTIEQTMHVHGKRFSLSKLHQYLFDEKFEGAHRAKIDVAALLRCCVELKKRELL